MKILLVNSFLHSRGGDTTCVRTSWNSLTARGHTVIPFAMRHPANDPSPWEVRFPPQLDALQMRGYRRAIAGVEAVWSWRAARALASLIADHRPDVAHLHHLHRHLTPSVLGPLARAGIPVVWTLHDYELLCPNGQLFTDGAPCDRCRGHHYEQAIRHRCKRGEPLASAAVAFEKWAHARLNVWQHVDRFLCPSQFLARKLVDFGIDLDRISWLPNPVADSGTPGPLGSDIVYAGRLAPEKGIRVLAEVARAMPERRFQVFGDGSERSCLYGLANVSVHGVVPPAQVAAALRSCGAAVVPSLWPENLPYAVLEAQLAARPVVASAVGGIPEQIDGSDGVLVPPGDSRRIVQELRALLDDPARAAAMGQRARARVLRDYDPETHVARLEAVYASFT